MEKKNSYEDIIELPHHQSSVRPHMSIHDRAAQFSPFAALTGHEAAIEETARLTDRQIQLDENEIALVDEALQRVKEKLADRPKIIVTYFVPDEKKEGGSYQEKSGVVKKLDEYARRLIFEDGDTIEFDRMIHVKEK